MTEEVLLPTSRSTDLPGFKVFSDGSELPGTVNVISVMVDKTVNKVPMARLLFKDGDAAEGSFLLSSGKELVPGKKIKIEAGYHNDFTTIFKGIAVKQNLRIKGKGNSFLEVECKDESYRMTVGRMNRYFSDATDSEAMEQVIGSYSDIEKDVQSTGVEHREMVQYHSSDWDFILCRAEANGRLVMADDGKITIKKPDFSADPTVTVTYGAPFRRRIGCHPPAKDRLMQGLGCSQPGDGVSGCGRPRDFKGGEHRLRRPFRKGHRRYQPQRPHRQLAHR